MMPLGLLRRGEKAEIVDMGVSAPAIKPASCWRAGCGPDKSALSSRVEDMGLRAGKVVQMLTNEGKGTMLIKIDESRIALGRGMAMKIMVRRRA